MKNVYLSIAFRMASLVPLILIFVPILRSYWQKINKINGLRRTRLSLLMLLFAIIFTNVYFIAEGIEAIAVNHPYISPNTYLLVLDKLINLIAFIMLYHFFKHASHHKK